MHGGSSATRSRGAGAEETWAAPKTKKSENERVKGQEVLGDRIKAGEDGVPQF